MNTYRKTLDVDVGEWGHAEKVTLKRLTIGDKCDIEDAMSSDLKVVGTRMTGSIKTGSLKLIYLHKSIVSAPFPHDMASLRDLDPDLAEYLLAQAEELNSPLDRGENSKTKDSSG